ncbi:hypothetical protein [Chryseolinea lacunae]|uniref:Uncharacterized protein n=1 Tax=Chryseolinea lacunae TaxID=2801331 RepID=A0ABS1KMS0_9BACT|nr:hypothetical protein [Chryseolinea lacunae]MBL0740754.1 hypothetical protein [Chryseolinea lacunae]
MKKQSGSYRYENVQIGNFILAMGYSLAMQKYSLPIATTLLPQIPENKTIGDLFGIVGGRNFIMEFKKDETSLKNELSKSGRVKLLNHLKNDTTLALLSGSAHWLCFLDLTSEKVDYDIRPYLTLNSMFNTISHQMNGFLQLLVKGQIGCTLPDLEKYTDLLKQMVDDDRYQPSGIVINYSKDGGIRFVPFDNGLELSLRISTFSPDHDLGRSQWPGMSL